MVSHRCDAHHCVCGSCGLASGSDRRVAAEGLRQLMNVCSRGRAGTLKCVGPEKRAVRHTMTRRSLSAPHTSCSLACIATIQTSGIRPAPCAHRRRSSNARPAGILQRSTAVAPTTISRRRFSPPNCVRHTVNGALGVGRLIADGPLREDLPFVTASTGIFRRV